MLVGSSRSLLCCDGQARQALANEADLRIRRGRVEPVDPAQLNRFEALLEVELGATESLWLPRKRGSGHLLLRATRLVEDPANPIIAICFREAGEELAPQWADFTEVFDLTAAEGRIVRFLLSGRSAEQIASENHLSVHTIRSHVSHVYAKIGVSCREELWRRLASYRLD